MENTTTSHKFFKTIGNLEGISLLCLFGIAMPIKYIGHNPLPVRVVGMIHGLLFLTYVYTAYTVSMDEKWPGKKLAAAIIASCLPCGVWWFEKKYKL